MKHTPVVRAATRVLSVPAAVGGVDVSSPPHRIRDDRLCDVLNLWHRDGVLKTRPAWCERGFFAAEGMPDAVPLGDFTLLHAQTDTAHALVLVDRHGHVQGRIHALPRDASVTAVPPHRTESTYAALVFVSTADAVRRGVYGLSHAGELTKLSPHVPRRLISARPTVADEREESGALFQPFNRLTDEFTCEYTADGTGLYYWLPEGVCPDMTHPFAVEITDMTGGILRHTVNVNKGDGLWKEQTEAIPLDGMYLAVDTRRGCFWFEASNIVLPVQATEANNVKVRAHRTATSGEAFVCGMRFGTWFGGTAGGTHLFLAGNPQHPNTVQWSALGDPLYFPENNFAYVGAADSAVTALAKQSDLLVIFKEREVYATQYLAGDTITAADLLAGRVTDTETAAATFPVVQIHPAVGCDCPRTVRLCGDRLSWFNTDGRVYALYTGGAYDVRSVREVSGPVAAELCRYTDEERAAATAVYHEGHYLLHVGRALYVMNTALDSRPWYIWDTPCDGLLTAVRETPLFITAGLRVHVPCEADADTVGGIRTPLRALMSTKWYELGAPEQYKHITGVRVWAAGTGELCVRLCDGREIATVRLHGAPLCDTLPLYLPVGLSRVRYGGITLECRGTLIADRLELTYRRMGEIRE